MMMASQVTIVEMAPVMARLLLEKMAPIRGVRSVVPQVGQPAPRAIRPVIRPAFSRLAELSEAGVAAEEDLAGLADLVERLAEGRFLFQRRVMRPMRTPCKIEMEKIGSQSRKG